MKRITLILFSVIMVFVTLCATAGPVLAGPPKIRVLIGFNRDNVSLYQTSRDIYRVGGLIKRAFKRIPVVEVEVSPNALSALSAMRGVSFIEEDGQVQAMDQVVPWGVERIHAPTVFSNNTGEGVKIAIIDTGIDYTHPDLAPNYVGGYDFYNNDNNPMDDNGHGTHVAGIAAAANNDFGVVGVAPNAKLYGIKVLNRNGGGYWSDVIAGMELAIDLNVQVINMSLGASSASSAMQSACDAAYDAGIVVVAAAGNSGSSGTVYPASYDSAIAVAASTSSDQRAYYSSIGPAVELTAPGDTIYSTLPGNAYGTKSGTSMASPHVAGVAALAFASGITDTNGDGHINDEIRTRLQETAEDLGSEGRDTYFGFGLVDAGAFGLQNQAPPAPEVAISPNPAYTGNDLTAVITHQEADPDGDDITYAYNWLMNGVDSGCTSATVLCAETTKGQTWTCVVTPSDLYADGEPGQAAVLIQNSLPVADAGPDQVVDAGSPASLDGSGSSDPDDDDNATLTYAWVQDGGDTVTLTGANTPNPTFTPPTTGEYNFTLTVTDQELASSSDAVVINAFPPNYAPELSSGTVTPDSGIYNTSFTFSVTYQDAEGDAPAYVSVSANGQTYDMHQVSGSDYTLGVVFQSDAITGKELGVGLGSYEFSANDSHKTTTFGPFDGPTVINTAPSPPTSVTISPDPADTTQDLAVSFGPSQDFDGDEIVYTYQWYRGTDMLGTENPLPSSATGKDESWTCTVTASDSHGGSSSTPSSNTVTIQNTPPIADAGPDQTAEKNSQVTLDGSGSSDVDAADEGNLDYLWVQDGGDTNTVTLTGADTAQPTFTPIETGLYTFHLTVTDTSLASDMDDVTINVIMPHEIRVASIDINLISLYAGRRTYAQVIITVLDAENKAAPGVSIAGHWTEATHDYDSGTTSSEGKIAFYSDIRRKPYSGTNFTFNIDSLSKSGWTWNVADSVMTATVTVP